MGGLIGFIHPYSLVLIENSYSSSNMSSSCVSECGVSIGVVFENKCSFSKVYYNDDLNGGLSVFGSGNCSDSTQPIPFNCPSLYDTIIANFDHEIWIGDNLNIENPITYGFCNCSNGCGIPSSLPPTTLTPSTTTPSTLIPSTTTPSTLIPSTMTPSTLTPSTTTPSTTTPSTITPTLSPLPSTNVPSTIMSTTTETTQPNDCLYKVLNCEKCGGTGIIVDSSLFNISCLFNLNEWGYNFSPLSPNVTTTISQTITLNQTTIVIGGNLEVTTDFLTLNHSTITILGNFNQSSNATIVLVLNTLSDKNAALNVSGCVTLSGNISLVLDTKPGVPKCYHQFFTIHLIDPNNYSYWRKCGS
eukprot:TRINITY_DN2137_c0_g1_i3.p1 TRINITY_DN2137_c0_g1~~TRINITY_DN2137_c0_g1_i3.p1  ORF type:complete len:416 (-),score=101.17 TRINITY_DN2137_c0_g1_i3:57-1130(-)